MWIVKSPSMMAGVRVEKRAVSCVLKKVMCEWNDWELAIISKKERKKVA